MNLDRVSSGSKLPDDFNVIIEIPAHGEPIKYEVDKETGAMFVDRFMSTAMHYPCNYGYIPHTLSEDGDPVDVLVITPIPLITGVVVRCRPVGMLKMTDEAGADAKLIAVPIDKLCGLYKTVQRPEDLPPLTLKQISTSSSTTRTSKRASGSRSKAGRRRRRARRDHGGVERYRNAEHKPAF
jgi:Inorganic pyrophosphatase